MTFELSAEHEAVRAEAAALADARVRPRAAEIDRTGVLPDELTGAAAAIMGDRPDAVRLIVVIEELSTASAALAMATIGSSTHTAPHGLSGLRGGPVPDDSARSQLALAAAALGLGRAALDDSLTRLRQSTSQPGQDEKPHWVVADAATELEAASLLTRAAAQALDRGNAQGEVALARLMTTTAARAAIDAALRIAGATAYLEGAVLERLSRDIRAVSLLLGTEDQHRARAAEHLLPG